MIRAAGKLRPAVPIDAGQLMRLRVELLEDETQADDTWLSAGEQWFTERLRNDRQFVAYVVVVDDQVVASAVGMLLPRMPQPDGIALRGQLTSVATLPAFRGRGFAKACITAVREWLVGNGAAYVELNATQDVQQLYQGLGFVQRADDPQMRWTPSRSRPQAPPAQRYPQHRGLVSTASGGLITRENNKVLLIRHKRSGWWLMPGGRGEVGEPPQQTAVREVREETGLEGTACPLLVLAFLTDRAELFPGAAKQSRAYPCHMTTFHITVDPKAAIRIAEDEVTDCRWWDVDEVTAEPGSLIDPMNAHNLRLAHAAWRDGTGIQYLEW